MAPPGLQFVAPGELGAFKPTTRCELPLCLGWEILPSPGSKGCGVVIRDVDNRMVLPVLYAASGS